MSHKTIQGSGGWLLRLEKKTELNSWIYLSQVMYQQMIFIFETH